MKCSIVNYAHPDELIMSLAVPLPEIEQAGQKQLIASDVIPTKLVGCTEKDLRQLGFILGDGLDEDPLFRYARRPPGWTIRPHPEGDARWSILLDELGRRRGAVFYRAGCYDRCAHLLLEPPGSRP